MKRLTQLMVAGAISALVSLPAFAAAKHEKNMATETKSVVTSQINSPINLNSATLQQLMELKGVGQKRAEAIISYRNANGKFASIEDLAKVKGFSAKRIARLLKQNPNAIEVH